MISISISAGSFTPSDVYILLSSLTDHNVNAVYVDGIFITFGESHQACLHLCNNI